jgi:hypothetical protein
MFYHRVDSILYLFFQLLQSFLYFVSHYQNLYSMKNYYYVLQLKLEFFLCFCFRILANVKAIDYHQLNMIDIV